MAQEELKEQFLEYAYNNLHNDTILKGIIELLNNISNELYESGYHKESDRLNTSLMIVKEVLEKESE